MQRVGAAGWVLAPDEVRSRFRIDISFRREETIDPVCRFLRHAVALRTARLVLFRPLTEQVRDAPSVFDGTSFFSRARQFDKFWRRTKLIDP